MRAAAQRRPPHAGPIPAAEILGLEMLVLRVPRLELVQALPHPLLTPDDVMHLAHLEALLALVRLAA